MIFCEFTKQFGDIILIFQWSIHKNFEYLFLIFIIGQELAREILNPDEFGKIIHLPVPESAKKSFSFLKSEVTDAEYKLKIVFGVIRGEGTQRISRVVQSLGKVQSQGEYGNLDSESDSPGIFHPFE